MPLIQLRDTIIRLFDSGYQIPDNPILSTVFMDVMVPKEHPMEAIFHPETSKTAVFGIHYFADKNTANDVYIDDMGSYWASPVYFHNGKPFEYISAFAFKFIPLNANQTKLTVRAIKPEIVNGTTCCGPHGNYSITQQVKPTTIEEYTLITYIASKLGVKGLPPVQFPK